MNLQERSDGLLEYQGRIHITIPSYYLDKPSSWNFTKRSNQRNSSIPSSGCGFCRTYEISEGKEERRKSLHCALPVQPNPRDIPGIAAELADRGNYEQSKEVHSTLRMHKHVLFSKRSVIQSNWLRYADMGWAARCPTWHRSGSQQSPTEQRRRWPSVTSADSKFTCLDNPTYCWSWSIIIWRCQVYESEEVH